MVLVPRHPINKRCIYRGLYTNGQSQLLYDTFSCFFIKWDEKVLVPFRHYYLTCYMPADSLALKLIVIGCWVIKWPWINFLSRFLTRKNQFPSQKRSWEEITRCVINPKECLKVTRIWIWTKLMSNWRRIMNMIWISLLTCSFHPCENHAWISWHQCANLQDSIKKKQSTLDNLFPPSLRYNLSLDGILSEGHERLCNHTKITSSKHSQEPFRCETYFAWQLLSRYPE